MTIYQNLPSRGKCRYLWTLEDYSGIAYNYESSKLYRNLFIRGPRRLDLDAIYYTSLLHLHREDDLLKYKDEIELLKNYNILPYRLELNKFAIEKLNLAPNNEMAKAYDAIQRINEFRSIDYFWKEYCTSKTLAVVGNAPTTIHNGQTIDDSDLVLRFNNFQLNGFEHLVGTRTDAWCRICDLRSNDKNIFKEKIKDIIFTDNPLNIPVGPSFLNEVLSEKKNFYFIPQNIVISIAKNLQAIPSSGARVLVSLHQNLMATNCKVSIFGFSFLNEKFNKFKFDHYFEGKSESRERAHSIPREVDLLSHLFKDHLSGRKDI